ncbi:MAG: hypothetical protein IPG60_05735 [Bacteroidetes bacterium]|nr:hypothetical protein [Bacteroidota bacterium]MBP7398444.1 hypothetical protein [Chitinophagales bacterium]MBK7109200.1 hypothetical protein [Bacteroidota bacterium]MBK8488479.1 hypothetical protein [Bacteroidota bacterium]MBK8681758.1 hypothetical protein [Bacteroidota bacterium]
MQLIRNIFLVFSQWNFKTTLKINSSYLLSIVLTAAISFSTVYLLGCNTIEAQNDDSKQQQNSSSINQDELSLKFPLDKSLDAVNKNITIVFTVDDLKRIHIVQISGGYNLLTEYIRKSLEGKVLESDNAVPGINYVMTVKFPSTV